MQVNEAMTNDVKIASPNETIRDAARLMAQKLQEAGVRRPPPPPTPYPHSPQGV